MSIMLTTHQNIEPVGFFEPTPTRPVSKAEQIVAAAHTLFLLKGYGSTSMDIIAAEANVSKRTVYSHFESKEKLFAEIVRGFCSRMGHAFDGKKPLCGKPEMVLRVFAENLLSVIMHPQAIATMRVILSEVEQFPELAATFWKSGPGPCTANLAAYLQEMNEQKLLRVDHPERSAMQFIGLIKGPYYDRLLLGILDETDRQHVDDCITDAIKIFLNGVRLSDNGT